MPYLQVNGHDSERSDQNQERKRKAGKSDEVRDESLAEIERRSQGHIKREHHEAHDGKKEDIQAAARGIDAPIGVKMRDKRTADGPDAHVHDRERDEKHGEREPEEGAETRVTNENKIRHVTRAEPLRQRRGRPR